MYLEYRGGPIWRPGKKTEVTSRSSNQKGVLHERTGSMQLAGLRTDRIELEEGWKTAGNRRSRKEREGGSDLPGSLVHKRQRPRQEGRHGCGREIKFFPEERKERDISAT